MNDHHEHEQSKEWPSLNPRVWVGSLSDYNAGRLHGDWMDAAVSASDLLAAVHRMLERSPEPGAEEWGIFDYDNFGDYQVGEHDDLAVIAAIARGIESHGYAFAAWATISDSHLDDLETEFEDCFMGHYDSTELFVDSVLDDFNVEQCLIKALPAWLVSHISIDRDGIARDMQAGDLHIEGAPEGGIYVFRL